MVYIPPGIPGSWELGDTSPYNPYQDFRITVRSHFLPELCSDPFIKTLPAVMMLILIGMFVGANNCSSLCIIAMSNFYP